MDAKQTAQQQYYATQAAAYDTRWKRENSNHLYKIAEIVRCFEEHLKPSEHGHDFLEVGGGTGIHASYFLGALDQRIRTFILSDLSPEMLEKAKVRLAQFSKVQYLVSSGEELATDKLFDGIFVSGAIHHFSRAEKSITEMKKHLKPNGLLVICEPIVWNPVNLVRALSMKEDWGQFLVRRSRVRDMLIHNNLELCVDRVLHWKGPNKLAETLWPYRALENFKILDRLAIMFLFAARRID